MSAKDRSMVKEVKGYSLPTCSGKEMQQNGDSHTQISSCQKKEQGVILISSHESNILSQTAIRKISTEEKQKVPAGCGKLK